MCECVDEHLSDSICKYLCNVYLYSVDVYTLYYRCDYTIVKVKVGMWEIRLQMKEKLSTLLLLQ